MVRVTLIRPCGLFRPGDSLEMSEERAAELVAMGVVAGPDGPRVTRPKAPAVTKEAEAARTAVAWDADWRRKPKDAS